MTIYTLVIYMFFIFVLGKNTYVAADTPQEINNNYVVVSDSKVSTLPLNPSKAIDAIGINSYRFYRGSFKDKLYAFQRTNTVVKNTNMHIWTSSDNGITWSQESDIPCTLDKAGGECDVMSTMVVGDELIVIYGNNTHYSVAKSTDGTKWDKGNDMDREPMANKKILYYSGKPSDLPINKEDPKRYIICFETDEAPVSKEDDKYVTVVGCAISDDEGQTFTVNYLLRILKTVANFSEIDQISFFLNDAYFIASTDENDSILFLCKNVESSAKVGASVMHCSETHKEGRRDFVPVLDINCDKDSSTIIIHTPQAYVMGFMSEHNSGAEILLNIKNDQLRIAKRDIKTAVTGSNGKSEALKKTSEVDGNKPITFHLIYVSEFVLSVMYEYSDVIYNITAELKRKRRGCEYIKEEKQKKEKDETTHGHYTETIFYDEISSATDKICALENFEPMKDETHISFFVKVPVEVDFENSENCFKQSYVEDDENKSPKHERSVIKIKNVVEFNDDPENKMKEIEFVYPASLHNFMKYYKKLTCTSHNTNFIITYTFQEDEAAVATVKFDTLVKDFTNAENRLSLKDYAWNTPIPEILIGSYIVDSTNYMKRFQVYENLLNDKPNAVDEFSHFEKKFPKEMNQYVSTFNNEQTQDYAGIDFTHSSQHYQEVTDINITADKTFSVKVVVPEEGSIVGLLCPLENSESLDELQCFDLVTDVEKNTVKFEELFKDIPFSISPKIMVYNQKLLAVESLLRLNKSSFDELAKITDAIQFHCKCKVNTHTATIKFAIGTSKSKFPEDSGDNNNNNNIIKPDPQPPINGSTHSILSAAIALLVLLNVFSCTSFLN